MKEYLILTLKCICVIAPIIGICIFAKVFILDYADQEAPYYIWNKEICNKKQEKDYNVLILGDSVCNAAYAPELLSDSTINLALGGTTPVENYYVLKEYLNNNKSPQIVYMSFADEHLITDVCFYFRIMYTHRFNLTELMEIVNRAEYYNEPSIITNTYIKDFWSYELYLPNKYIASIMNGSFNQRIEENINSINSIELYQGRYISLGNAENEEINPVTFSEFKVAPLFDEYYRKIIELCANNGIIVRIVKLPMDENALFTEEYEKQFHTYYNQLLDEYSNLTVDWIKGGYGHFYFKDLVHMNNRGARMFSEILKELYTEDFSKVFSDNQYNVLDNDIQNETDCSELFYWISGKEYTIMVYDGVGDWSQKYINELQNNTKLSNVYSGYDNIYFISGTNDETLYYDIEFLEGYYKITTKTGAEFEWYPPGNGVGICVINDRNGAQTCMKNF